MHDFNRAMQAKAPFGAGISLGDHCLQVATEVLHADWVPHAYRRDMVVMALFHDVYYNDSPDDHGRMVSELLDGRIHPHVSSMLSDHTLLGAHEMDNDKGSIGQFGVCSKSILDAFYDIDRSTLTSSKSCLPLDYFEESGYFRPETHSEMRSRPSWLSPNGTLVWAAPSMWIERTPVLLAMHLGLFEAASLPTVELMVTNGGPELLKNVSEGRAHIGEIGLFPYLADLGTSKPAPAKLVGSTFIQQLDHYLATGDPSIQILQQLKGRRVGVLSTGSCDSYLLRAMLLQAGVNPSEVEAVPLGALYGSHDVLRNRHVDATFLVEPALSDGEEKGHARVLTKFSALYPRFQWGALFASDALREEAPEIIERVFEVYRNACCMMYAAVMRPDEMQESQLQTRQALREIAQQWFGLSEATFLRALRRDAEKWQLDWRNVDYAGAEVCIDIQEDLGVFPRSKPSIRHAFIDMQKTHSR